MKEIGHLAAYSLIKIQNFYPSLRFIGKKVELIIVKDLLIISLEDLGRIHSLLDSLKKIFFEKLYIIFLKLRNWHFLLKGKFP